MPVNWGELARVVGSGLKEAVTGESREFPKVLQDVRFTDRISLHDIVGAKDDLFRTGGKPGEDIGNMFKQYQVKRAQIQQQLQNNVKQVSDGVMKHPTLSKTVHYSDTPLKDIHDTFVKENNPLRNITAKLGGPTGDGFKKSLEDHSINTISQARVLASGEVFGPKMQNLMPYMMNAFDSKEPTQISWAKAVMNVISNETHDNTDVFNPILGTMTKVSRTKADIQRSFKRENVLRETLEPERSLLPQLDVSTTYSTAGVMEHRLNNFFRAVQLPLVALKHLSQIANLSSIPARNLAKGMLEMKNSEFRTFLDTSAILAYTQHDMMDKQIRGRFGQISKWTTSPTAGELFYRSYHMPFFDYVRTNQLTLSASVGYQSATMWAKQALEGNKRALLELEEMGININDVRKQGGILTPDQKIQAMFHFTNNRFFMDKSVERSLASNSNFFMRSATMYHTFINAQQRFMRRELYKMWKAEDYMGIAKFAGTLGVLFPSVTPWLKSLEVFGRTFNADEAGQKAEEDYDKLMHGNFGDRFGTYLNLLAHTGSIGIWNNYIGAAKTDRFAYQLLGPNIAATTRFIGDAIKSAAVTNKAGKHNIAPPIRDLLETIPILGSPLAHKIAPTEKEARAAAGYTPRPSRSRPNKRKVKNMWEY